MILYIKMSFQILSCTSYQSVVKKKKNIYRFSQSLELTLGYIERWRLLVFTGNARRINMLEYGKTSQNGEFLTREVY